MEDSIIRIIQLEEDIRNETLQLAIIQEKMPVDIKTLALCSALFQIIDTHEKVFQKIPVEVPKKHDFGQLRMVEKRGMLFLVNDAFGMLPQNIWKKSNTEQQKATESNYRQQHKSTS